MPAATITWAIASPGAGAGARLGYVYFDSVGAGVYVADDAAADPLFDGQKVTNTFVGAGPHLLSEGEYRLGSRSLSLYGRVEGSYLFGQVRQHFEETFIENGNTTFGSTDVSSTQAVPIVQTEIGLKWRPRWWYDRWTFALGYTFEQWWNIGNAGGSKAELWSQGGFFRGEFAF